MYIVNDAGGIVKWENGRNSQGIFGHMDEKTDRTDPLSDPSGRHYMRCIVASSYFSIS